MCIFTSDKDIPGHVRLTTRTLQYLIIPLLSAALLVIGKINPYFTFTITLSIAVFQWISNYFLA